MLIAIEGIDGAGKRTQTERLVQALLRAGKRSASLSFPRYGETGAAEVISRYLNGRYGPKECIAAHLPALLYAEDRFKSRAKLAALSSRNDVVVVDRYVASNLAYQGARCPPAGRRSFIDWIAHIEYDVYGMQQVALTVYLDVPVGTSAALVAKKDMRDYTRLKADIHEQDSAYLGLCRDVYLELCKRQYRSTWASINCLDAGGGLRSIEDIHGDVWGHMDAVLSGKSR